jgi:hypothetical protein
LAQLIIVIDGRSYLAGYVQVLSQLATQIRLGCEAAWSELVAYAEQRDPPAEIIVAVCHAGKIFRIPGRTTASSPSIPPGEGNIVWLRQEAEAGSKYCQYYLACCYSSGISVEVDLSNELRWLYRSAEQHYVPSQNCLGFLCDDKGQLLEAVRWYRLAADQGYAEAQCNLGLCYERGDGVAKSEEEAVSWYRLAADQGHAEAQCNLGVCYERGIGVVKLRR